jgi:hypothetical protein
VILCCENSCYIIFHRFVCILLSMMKKFQVYALLMTGGDAATAVVGPAAATVVEPSPAGSHDTFVAQLVRYRGDHIKPGDVTKVVGDYNILVAKPGALKSIKDPYMLTLYLIVCDVSLRNEGEQHKALNTACKSVEGEKERMAVGKLTTTLEHVHPATEGAAASASAAQRRPPGPPPRAPPRLVPLSSASGGALGGATMPLGGDASHHMPAPQSLSEIASHARREIIEAWKSRTPGGAFAADTPDPVKDAITVLEASVPVHPPFGADVDAEWELCKALARNMKINRFEFDRRLMDYLCWDMPVKFVDSVIPWQMVLEDYLFQVSSGQIGSWSHPLAATPSDARVQIMRIWHKAISRIPRIDSKFQTVQVAVWLLYLNDEFMQRDLHIIFDERDLCTKLQDSLDKEPAQVFITKSQITSPREFMMTVCLGYVDQGGAGASNRV